jgi:hypothetical protein
MHFHNLLDYVFFARCFIIAGTHSCPLGNMLFIRKKSPSWGFHLFKILFNKLIKNYEVPSQI